MQVSLEIPIMVLIVKLSFMFKITKLLCFKWLIPGAKNKRSLGS